MSLYQYSRNKPCYYCSADPPSTREHVPPRMLFKGFEFSAISVPSCAAHNIEKHGGDQGFITALKLGLKQLIDKGLSSRKISIKIKDSIISVSPSQIKRVGALRQFILDAPERLDVTFPYLETAVDLYQWIRYISAGLIWARIGNNPSGIDWSSAIVRSPNFIQSRGPLSHQKALEHAKLSARLNEMAESMGWVSGWYRKPKGYPEEIYQYSVSHFDDDSDGGMRNLIIRHTFYRNFTFYLMVEVPFSITEQIYAQ